MYTRPAIPAYFHSIWLFVSETYAYVIDRAFFYIQVFLYSFLAAKLLSQYLEIDKSNTVYFLATLGALVTIHNYPPMAWNTIDGVFFCMIGLYAILKKDTDKWSILLGSIMMVLGTFSKQSFYFMPIFLFLYLILNRDFFRLKYYVLFGAIGVAMYVGFKYFTDSLWPFIEQTFPRGRKKDLYFSGYYQYYKAIKNNLLEILSGGIITFLLFRFLPKKYGYLIFNIGVATCMIYLYNQEDSNRAFKRSIIQLLFLSSCVIGFWKYLKNKNYAILLLLLLLSWSASISNGFKTPVHFSLPILFGIYLLFFGEIKKENLLVYGIIIALFFGVFHYGYQTIYRDSNRAELGYKMEEVFPQLKFIKSDKETYKKFKEFNSLAKRHENFTVLPSITQAHYLTKTKNPIGIEWPLDVEINNEAKLLLKELEANHVTVLMETTDFSEKQLKAYEIKDLVEQHWVLVEEYEYFKVYQPY